MNIVEHESLLHAGESSVYMPRSGIKDLHIKPDTLKLIEKKLGGRWWCTPLIPVLGRQRQVDFWVRGQPGLNSEFQDSQGYTEKPCVEKTNQPTNQPTNQTNKQTKQKRISPGRKSPWRCLLHCKIWEHLPVWLWKDVLESYCTFFSRQTHSV